MVLGEDLSVGLEHFYKLNVEGQNTWTRRATIVAW